jgi:1-acyl-sn-glycerol-3-phosphate acyltransferase
MKLSKQQRRQRTVFYSDSHTDDFGDVDSIDADTIDDSYHYEHGVVWHVLSFVLYRVIGVPLAWLISKVVFHVRVKNRRALKKVKGGFFLYTTHTHELMDDFMPSVVSFPRRAYIVANPRAVTGSALGFFVPLFGGIPLNDSAEGKQRFRERLAQIVAGGDVVAIMPEAHLWPYYNGIRHFTPYSFTYPVHDDAPVVGCTMTYRQRRILKNRKPYITVTLSDPIFPQEWQGKDDPKTYLRDRVYDFMCETVKRENSYSYIDYEQR